MPRVGWATQIACWTGGGPELSGVRNVNNFAFVHRRGGWRGTLLATAVLAGLLAPRTAVAQDMPSWMLDSLGIQSSRPRSQADERRGSGSAQGSSATAQPQSGPYTDPTNGGARPQIAPAAPPTVAFNAGYAPNSIVVDSGGKALYYVLPGRRAYRYRISVGREGFTWTGTETVSRKQAWPDWHPPAEMRQRDPRLPVKMSGGVRNPLGAVALYLGNSLYRIHGTNDERTIGLAASSGCFRMMNANAMHLAAITPVGTRVTVVKRLAVNVASAPTS